MINDQGYFKEFPAPIFEASCKDHIDTIINHCNPYYGPLMYWLVRCSAAQYVVEIGVNKAYTSYFMASGVKDNCTRQGTGGMYYGLDISGEIFDLEKKLRDKGLPVTMLNMDSWDMTPETFGNNRIGLAYIDGWHSRQHLMREVGILYKMLHGNGRGWLVIHDVYSHVVAPMQEILKDPEYKWEYVRFPDNYGLGILRKMEDYTEDPKTIWPQGPEPDLRNEDGTLKPFINGVPYMPPEKNEEKK